MFLLNFFILGVSGRKPGSSEINSSHAIDRNAFGVGVPFALAHGAGMCVFQTLRDR